PQVAQHLCRRGGDLVAPVRAAVERAAPALGLDDGRAELVALPFLRTGHCPVLGGGIGVEDTVGNIGPAARFAAFTDTSTARWAGSNRSVSSSSRIASSLATAASICGSLIFTSITEELR